MHLLGTKLIKSGEQTIQPCWLVTSREDEARGMKLYWPLQRVHCWEIRGDAGLSQS